MTPDDEMDFLSEAQSAVQDVAELFRDRHADLAYFRSHPDEWIRDLVGFTESAEDILMSIDDRMSELSREMDDAA